MPREEDRHLDVPHVLGPASAIKEIHFRIVDSDDVVKVALSLEEQPSQFILTENNIRIWIKSADTGALAYKQSYKFGVEIIDQNDLHYTPLTGAWLLTDDVVNDGGTAPYLTWATREDLQTEIDAQTLALNGAMTTFNLTALAAAASATDTSITVKNDSFISVSDTIRIMLNDETYDERTVDTVSNNIITFTGGLSDDAAIDNIVRKV